MDWYVSELAIDAGERAAPSIIAIALSGRRRIASRFCAATCGCGSARSSGRSAQRMASKSSRASCRAIMSSVRFGASETGHQRSGSQDERPVVTKGPARVPSDPRTILRATLLGRVTFPQTAAPLRRTSVPRTVHPRSYRRQPVVVQRPFKRACQPHQRHVGLTRSWDAASTPAHSAGMCLLLPQLDREPSYRPRSGWTSRA